jgi:hypothetical protein
MHGVVLLLHVVKVTSMLVDSIVAKDVLEQLEGVEVRVLNGGSVVEDSHIRVDHLVVTDEHESWNVNRTLSVLLLRRGQLRKVLEGVLNLVNELVVVNVTSTNNNDVVSNVVRSVEVANVVNSQGLENITVSLNGLAEHVLTVDVEVRVLNGRFKVSLVVLLVLISYLKLGSFELSSGEGAAAHKVAEELNSLANVALEDLELKRGQLSVSLALVAASHVLYRLGDLAAGARVCSTEKHLLKKVGSA